ncbi:2-oxoacid ferredoxin oxidoreductase [Photorhabdus australis subsp. thailandensis]|uniref:2-oxoacid ferredoxin oxidoreductase n=1 Tax=Photorhabdus australis subsp. thailandensis TaxID=2805096 RepID=A0A1C0U276_9GAMM|nr:indolepyruvate ferredoxin oxidoreductase family protein [Photorhabdus australis]OCQ52001.1 2-oxoacid ferredoxin oxidoreductase [Photorhabdus australis subsp. thailandensis]
MILDTSYRLESRYRRGIDEPQGKIFISGQQALVRMLLAQSALDRSVGLNTAGFVSGYRGSPLGGVDKELWAAKNLLEQANIRFQPGINEDLAATTLIGTQRVETDQMRRVDGVFGLWYGKGPGVDRSGDALRHGNAYGSSPHGGVLVVIGDDHGCVSSSMSHQSDQALIAWGLPVIHPINLQDYEYCGLWGWALSRFSGLWVGFKAITETVEATASVNVSGFPSFKQPEVDVGPDGLHWRWPDLPGMQIERRFAYKLEAARRFISENPLDKVDCAPATPKLLIAAVGKAYLDIRGALDELGITLTELEAAGIALFGIRVVYPLSPVLKDWAKRSEKVWIIEEKAGIVENSLKASIFNSILNTRPLIIGKFDENGIKLLPSEDELRPSRIVNVLVKQLRACGLSVEVPSFWSMKLIERSLNWVKRTPYLCSGCPHNSSTVIPEGSQARLGIGCHALAARIPERATTGSVQMGGEGVDWVGQMPFVKTEHIFQNMGDGTFFHSGYLAIRQAIAAKTNITYKILYNDAVAMTGGQPLDGSLNVEQVATLVCSEGAKEVVIVAKEPERYKAKGRLPAQVKVYHRDQLNEVQLRLRAIPGVTVLIYDQVCAAEDRRRRKRHPVPAKKTYITINELVCEGCGDCQIQSNCLSVIPVDTEFGAKRAIDSESCNTDLSCLKGFCPSFVTVTGKPRLVNMDKTKRQLIMTRADKLPLPQLPDINQCYEILITGVGGTGVVTMAATIGLAAHLQDFSVSVLDFTGFTQKGGSVFSHIRIGAKDHILHQHRIDRGCANVLIAADLTVASEDEALNALLSGQTKVIANTHEMQTGSMVRDRNLKIDTSDIEKQLIELVGKDCYDAINARYFATQFVGSIQTNILLLGYAWQKGVIPLSLQVFQQAINLQGGDVAANKVAFACGRLLATDPAYVQSLITSAAKSYQFVRSSGGEQGLRKIVESRSRYLTDYQNKRYAAKYRAQVDAVVKATANWGDFTLAHAVARNLFKLMAYKDEYEVARLHSSPQFLNSLTESYIGRPKLNFHLAPPFLGKWLEKNGYHRKITVSGWIIPFFRGLAALRCLRHTFFDIFAWSHERREERRLIAKYKDTLNDLLSKVSPDNLSLIVQWAEIPENIRGYGHIKERSIAAAYKRQDELLNQIANGGATIYSAIPIKEVN